MCKVRIEVSRKERDWRVKIFEDGAQIGHAAIGCSEKTAILFVKQIIRAYLPLPPKPPSLLAKAAVRDGSIEFESPLGKTP